MNILNLSDDILSLIKKELNLIRSKKYYEKVKEEFENEGSRRRPYYRVHNSMRRIHEGRFYLTGNPGPIINSQFINRITRLYIDDQIDVDEAVDMINKSLAKFN